jgi:hypothetical protein
MPSVARIRWQHSAATSPDWRISTTSHSFSKKIEPDGKGAPVLLRQYLKLGGRLACFNVDESFSGVVDGLIVVDLLRTEPKVLQKYMGREQAAAFSAYTREQPRSLADTHAVS